MIPIEIWVTLIESLLTFAGVCVSVWLSHRKATAKLEARELTINNAGSIAEASLQLCGVFEAAQAAGEQYLQNIQRLSQQQEEICAEMERQTQQKCDEMVAQAELASKVYWDQISQRLDAYYKEHPGLRQQLAATPEDEREYED